MGHSASKTNNSKDRQLIFSQATKVHCRYLGLTWHLQWPAVVVTDFWMNLSLTWHLQGPAVGMTDFLKVEHFQVAVKLVHSRLYSTGPCETLAAASAHSWTPSVWAVLLVLSAIEASWNPWPPTTHQPPVLSTL